MPYIITNDQVAGPLLNFDNDVDLLLEIPKMKSIDLAFVFVCKYSVSGLYKKL